MPATCVELMLSRRIVHGESAEFQYLVQGTDSEADALAAVLAAAPASYVFTVDGVTVTLPRQAPELEPLHVTSGDGMWQARVDYRPENRSTPPQEDESSFSFDTTGGTQKVTQSLQTIGSYPAGAPDFKGAIGFDGEKVEGCDITVPVYKFSETHFKGAAFVNGPYKAAVMALTGQVNSAGFRGFAAGEVLFLGASGARRGRSSSDLWELSFHFAVSKNRASFDVGGITVAAKAGWEYLWVLYEDAVDPGAKARIRRPRAVYVEKVYETGDFAGLGIGTGA